MKSYDEIASEVLRRRDNHIAKRNAKRRKISYAVLVFCFTAITTIGSLYFSKSNNLHEQAYVSETNHNFNSSDPLSPKYSTVLNALEISDGYKAELSIESSKISEEKTIKIGNDDIDICYNYSVNIVASEDNAMKAQHEQIISFLYIFETEE